MMALWEPGEDGSRSYNDATEVFGSKAGEIEIKNEIFDRTKTARPCSLVAVPWVFEPLWVSLIFLRRREGSPHHLLWCWLWTFRLCELSCRKDEGSSGARDLYTRRSSLDRHIRSLAATLVKGQSPGTVVQRDIQLRSYQFSSLRLWEISDPSRRVAGHIAVISIVRRALDAHAIPKWAPFDRGGSKRPSYVFSAFFCCFRRREERMKTTEVDGRAIFIPQRANS